MNITSGEATARPVILVLWWLKARRAASGQNKAASKYGVLDAWFTALNILLPLLVLVLGFGNSIARRLDATMPISLVDAVSLRKLNHI
ncbi:MAG TPA: hypothetical protein VJA87_01250 [Candidatus Paceibacterota bacterium]